MMFPGRVCAMIVLVDDSRDFYIVFCPPAILFVIFCFGLNLSICQYSAVAFRHSWDIRPALQYGVLCEKKLHRHCFGNVYAISLMPCFRQSLSADVTLLIECLWHLSFDDYLPAFGDVYSASVGRASVVGAYA